jgi:hypothetical protein
MPKTVEKPQSAAPLPAAASPAPSQEEIALRAYHIYLQRGATPGSEFADWIQAERELLAEVGKVRRKANVKSIAA